MISRLADLLVRWGEYWMRWERVAVVNAIRFLMWGQPGRSGLDRPEASAIFLAWRGIPSVPMIAAACRCTCSMRAALQAFIGSKQKPKPRLGLRDKGLKCRTLPSGTKSGTGPYSQRYLPRDPSNHCTGTHSFCQREPIRVAPAALVLGVVQQATCGWSGGSWVGWHGCPIGIG